MLEPVLVVMYSSFSNIASLHLAHGAPEIGSFCRGDSLGDGLCEGDWRGEGFGGGRGESLFGLFSADDVLLTFPRAY